MAQKRSLSVAEIKALLVARSKYQTSADMRLRERMNQIQGISSEDQRSEDVAWREKTYDMMHEVIARRLKANRRSVPLLSKRDFVRMVNVLLNDFARSNPDFGVQERKMLKKVLSAMFKSIAQEANGFSNGENPYERYWRWINGSIALAAEKGVAPADLFIVEGAYDELMRRLYTKREYRLHLTRGIRKISNITTLKKIILQPVLGVLAKGDATELRAMKWEIEKEAMPKLKEMISKFREVMRAYVNEEIARIWQ